MSPIELGKFIASLRNEKNLTQEELAEKLYIDKRKISRWECGNSIPEFEMLIKLSEILDVSLYELSICKKVEKETLTRKTINQFKSIKDFKKFKFKKKIKIIILIIFFILFIITATYTIKNNGTVEIYELSSLDDNYHISGNYIYAKKFNSFYIKEFYTKSNDKSTNSINSNSCNYKVYNNSKRFIYIINNKRNQSNSLYQEHYQEGNNYKLNSIIKFEVSCLEANNTNTYYFDAKVTKIYDNKLF